MEKKYVLIGVERPIKTWYGRETTLRRVVALKDFDVSALRYVTVFEGDKKSRKPKIYTKHIKVGQLGGWIESEANLSQESSAWVDDDAIVFDASEVKDDAWVGGHKTVVGGKVIVCDGSKIFSDDDSDDDKGKTHRTDVVGDMVIKGFSNITTTLLGEGIVKGKLIDQPMIARPVSPSKPKKPAKKAKPAKQAKPEDPKTIVRFSCTVGDKTVSSQYSI